MAPVKDKISAAQKKWRISVSCSKIVGIGLPLFFERKLFDRISAAVVVIRNHFLVAGGAAEQAGNSQASGLSS